MTRIGRAVVLFLLMSNGLGMTWLGILFDELHGGWSWILALILACVALALFFYLLWNKEVKL